MPFKYIKPIKFFDRGEDAVPFEVKRYDIYIFKNVMTDYTTLAFRVYVAAIEGIRGDRLCWYLVYLPKELANQSAFRDSRSHSKSYSKTRSHHLLPSSVLPTEKMVKVLKDLWCGLNLHTHLASK